LKKVPYLRFKRTIPLRNWILLLFSALLCACTTTPDYVTIDGILEVPENRGNPNSRTLKLVYKVLKAKDTTSGKAPILFLQGGAGLPTLFMETFWENHPLRKERDIVLMDQRGTGASQANCTDLGKAMFTIMRKNLDQEAEIKALDSLLSKCKEALKQKEIDLAGYTSKANAADFEDLRKALGYDKWNLFGGSYGSRSGFTIMRDFPKSVRSAVFTGIFAPETDLMNGYIQNFENSFFSVLERCEKDEDCNSRYPNLKERFSKTLKKLRTAPLHLNYKGNLFVLNAQDAFVLIHLSLYDRQSIVNIPQLIEAFENGEPEPVRNVLKGVEYLHDFLNFSVHYSLMAYEELPFYDAAAKQKSLNLAILLKIKQNYFFSGTELMSNWHKYRATDFEDQPVVSEIPTLMASGGLDPVTPVSNANVALKHLENGYGIEFPDEGHNIINPCFFQIAEDFFNDPSHKPNIDCSLERKPIEWNLSNPLQ